MKKIRAYFLLESLLLAFLYVGLLSGLVRVFLYQQQRMQHIEQQKNQYINLMGFESLFSNWMQSFGVLACLYPVESKDNTLFLHHQAIWQQTPQRLIFFTGDLKLIEDTPFHMPKNTWIITQSTLSDDLENVHTPYWVFSYQKKILKIKQDKIYLEHDGQTQMLLDGLKGFRVKVGKVFVELSIQEPYFFKRYDLCQIFKKDLAF